MRLLDVRTFQLQDWADGPPPYAILSHRWEEDEVLFEDLTSDRPEVFEKAQGKLGFIKLVGACERAKEFGLNYLWSDTCCIDKKSSAELSEAINSMYRYYQKAIYCFAYLAGLPEDVNVWTDEAFANHEWFARGWTLQELIAPEYLIFYTERRKTTSVDPAQPESCRTTEWIDLGMKAEMCGRLAEITGISAGILMHTEEVGSVSVARRMSWAAKRVTTRVEDQAYCLLGLFGISMPMLYGEGGKAFIRLQEEIMKDSNDESLFAWKDENADPDKLTGLLATSPSMFKDSGNFFSYFDWEPRVPYFKTNHGLQITLRLRPVGGSTFLAALNCPQPEATDGFAEIYLKRLRQTTGTRHAEDLSRQHYDQYARVASGTIVGTAGSIASGPKTSATTIYVHQNPPQSALNQRQIYPENLIQLRQGPSEAATGYRVCYILGESDVSLKDIAPGADWIPSRFRRVYRHPKGENRLAVVLVIERPERMFERSRFTILLGSASDRGDPAADVIDADPELSFEEWSMMFEPQKDVRDGDECKVKRDLGTEIVQVSFSYNVRFATQYLITDIMITKDPKYSEPKGESKNGGKEGKIKTPFETGFLVSLKSKSASILNLQRG